MRNVVGRIKLEIKRNKKRKDIEQAYTKKDRLIPYEIYSKLKAKRKCQECKQKIRYPPEIHHKIPVSKGGTNTEENLKAVCKKCHEKLDGETKNEQTSN